LSDQQNWHNIDLILRQSGTQFVTTDRLFPALSIVIEQIESIRYFGGNRAHPKVFLFLPLFKMGYNYSTRNRLFTVYHIDTKLSLL